MKTLTKMSLTVEKDFKHFVFYTVRKNTGYMDLEELCDPKDMTLVSVV